MTRKDNLYASLDDIPIPTDDGACDHLLGMSIPSVSLMSTAGRVVNLANTPRRTVVYCYPRTGRPNVDPPKGWNEIPGARGCTPQACAFRDHFKELQSLGAHVFGLSTQNSEYQQEAVERLQLPFELLSDSELTFTGELGLPTLEFESVVLIKRLTLIIFEGRIEKFFYPIFPPEKNAEEVIEWLSQNQRI